MSDDDESEIRDELTQRTSLIEPKRDPSNRRKSGRWRGLLKWKKTSAMGEDGNEDSALLASCPNLGYNPHGEESADVPMTVRRISPTTHASTSFDDSGDSIDSDESSHGSSDDSDSEDEENNELFRSTKASKSASEPPVSRRSFWKGSKSNSDRGFLNFSSRRKELSGERSSLLNNVSDNVLNFQDESNSADPLFEDDRPAPEDSEDDDGDDDDGGLEEEEDASDDESHDSSDSDSVSSSSASTSSSTSSLANPNERSLAIIEDKSNASNGRIEGFGNSVPEVEPSNPRTLRERLKNYRVKRTMQRMQIGRDGNAPGTSRWRKGLGGLVGSVLPPSNDDDLVESTTIQFDDRDTCLAPGGHTKVEERSMQDYINARTEMNDDEDYIAYLQSELQSRDTEISELKQRLHKLDMRAVDSDTDDELCDNGEMYATLCDADSGDDAEFFLK